MPIATVKAVLVADTGVQTIASDRVSPLETQQGIGFPNITLTVAATEPINSLAGFEGLDRHEVQVDAWAYSYTEALALANAARKALEAAGHTCTSRLTDEFISEPGTDPGVYRVGYVHQVWISS